MNELQFVEVDQDDKLPPIIKELLRWRDIIGKDYDKSKQSKTRSTLA